MQLQVSSEQVGPVTVVKAVGELDLHTAPALREELDRVVAAGGRQVVVDLGEVGFMDSTGLSVIVATVAALRANGGDLSVVSGVERITKVFTLTGVDQQIGLFQTLDEALA